MLQLRHPLTRTRAAVTSGNSLSKSERNVNICEVIGCDVVLGNEGGEVESENVGASNGLVGGGIGHDEGVSETDAGVSEPDVEVTEIDGEEAKLL